MNRDACQSLEERLVDFADDSLAGAEVARVHKHLERCAHCRATVEALRQSLEVAQTIWLDNARDISQTRASQSHKWRYGLVAACILLGVGTLLYKTTPQQPAASAPTLAEIENRIAASGRAARLLARIDQLETQTSLREVAESQYRYIMEKYPDTPAAASARLKLESHR